MLQQDWLEDLFHLGRITAEEYVTEIDKIREGLLLQIAEIDQALARIKIDECPECSGLRIPCEHCGNSGWGEETRVIETKEVKEVKEVKEAIEFKQTNRGFELGIFEDRYKQKCSIQDSSLAEEAAIWLGVNNTGPDIKGPNGNFSEEVSTRMHLNQSQVEELLPVLNRFVKNGTIA